MDHFAPYTSPRELENGNSRQQSTSTGESDEKVDIQLNLPQEATGAIQNTADNTTQRPSTQRIQTSATIRKRRKIKFGRGLYASNNPDPDPGLRRRQKRRIQFGLEPDAQLKQHHEGGQDLLWSRARSTLQEPFSEFLGVLVFTMIAQGGVAQATLSAGEKAAPGGNGYGSYTTVPFCTGIGAMLGVYIAGDSGSYLNPAVTIANCLFRGLPWRVVPALTIAQLLGAFVGTGITWGIYKPAIEMYAGGVLAVPPASHATASIFTSFPQAFSTTTSQVFSVIQRSAILLLVISALKDDLNMGQQISPGGGNMFPLNLFFTYFGLTASTGWQTSGQLNPAFDLGSRIMLSVLGYPKTIWTMSNGYAWIPIVMPVIGACFGAWLYDVFVFTGASPVNTPCMGLQKLVTPSLDLRNRRQRYEQRHDDGNTLT